MSEIKYEACTPLLILPYKKETGLLLGLYINETDKELKLFDPIFLQYITLDKSNVLTCNECSKCSIRTLNKALLNTIKTNIKEFNQRSKGESILNEFPGTTLKTFDNLNSCVAKYNLNKIYGATIDIEVARRFIRHGLDMIIQLELIEK